MHHSELDFKNTRQSSPTRESEIEQTDIDNFKSKYVFKPFDYEQCLEQTLKYQIDALNPKVPKAKNGLHAHNHINSINYEQQSSLRSSNVRFGVGSNGESYNSTAKSINTNETITDHDPAIASFARKQKNHPSIVPTQRSPLGQPPDLLKKAISFTSAKSQLFSSFEQNNIVQNDFKGNRLFKKGLMNKKKYEQEQKQKGFVYNKKHNVSPYKASDSDIKNHASFKSSMESIQQKQGSMCLSIALESLLIHNFIKATFQNSLNNSHFFTNPNLTNPPTKNASIVQEPLNFYQFCMLLFPQTSKSLPCSVPIMDTLFYLNSPENKQIIYVFKEKRRNLLMKMKNKNKSAYQLFMKRRAQYEIVRAREQKLRKTGWLEGKEGMIINGTKQNWLMSSTKSKLKNTQKSACTKQVKFRSVESFVYSNSLNSSAKMKSVGRSRKFEASVKCLEDSNCDEKNNSKKAQKNSIAEQDEATSSRQGIKGTKKVINGSVNEKDDKKSEKDVEVGNKNQEMEQVIINNRDSCVSDSSALSHLSCQSGFPVNVKTKIMMTNLQFENVNYSNSEIQQKENSKNQVVQSNPKLNKSQSKQSVSNQSLRSSAPQQQVSNEQHSLLSSPRLTPSNSVRQSIHTLQTNYMAILKYLNNQTIRLKQQQFKAIFHNPLYANQRFKNNNNTQYIQALPIEDEFKDLKVYSIHFHFELFKDEPLFKYVKDSLFKENQYMFNNLAQKNNNLVQEKEQISLQRPTSHNVRTKTSVFEFRSPQNIRNAELKQKLKLQSIEVYLYYQIFQMYTYASMHYNKQILNGIFRFIEYDSQYVLFQTENIVAKNLPVEGEFIKAKIFAEEKFDQLNTEQLVAKLKLKAKLQPTPMATTITTHQHISTGLASGIDTPSQTMKKINKQLLKLTLEQCGIYAEQTELQKQLLGYFSERNNNIEQQMSNYFTDKIEKIKNIKDSHLSKNIFKIINDLPTTKEQNSQLPGKNQTQKKQISYSAQSPKQSMDQKKSLTNCKNSFPNDFQDFDFHSILNDDKKLQKFLKEKEQNDPYARKNISNYSVVRWRQQIKKAKERKSHNSAKQGNMSVQYNGSNDQSQVLQNQNKKYLARPMTACSIGKSRAVQIQAKFKKLGTTEMNLAKSFSCQKQNIGTFKQVKPNFINTCSSTQPLQKDRHSQSMKMSIMSPTNMFIQSQKQAKRFEKKLINERYTQVNKAKFTFNSFNKIF